MSKELFNKTVQDVLTGTPKSKLMTKPTAKEDKKKRKEIENQITDSIAKDKAEIACSLVLQNRISWNTYDKMRKSEGLTTPRRPRVTQTLCRNGSTTTCTKPFKLIKNHCCKKLKHGQKTKTLIGQLARNYGLHSPSSGQIIKKFLEQNGIPAASINQRPTRAKRRCIKKVCSDGPPFSMFPPVQHGKQKLLGHIQKGEVNVGEEVVPSSYQTFTVDSNTQIQEKTVHYSARKIPCADIRKKLLQKHECLGNIRDSSDAYFDKLSTEDVDNLIVKLNIHTPPTTEDKKEWLKQICRTRHIKMWHDHSTIAAHGLVLVSVIYDPAFFYTTKEMTALKGVRIDVPALLNEAEVHILGRSSSSLQDQLAFIETRRESLKDIKEKVCTSNGVEVIDVVRFFYGDGPAAQFNSLHAVDL